MDLFPRYLIKIYIYPIQHKEGRKDSEVKGIVTYINIFICKNMYLMSPCPLLRLVTSEKFVALVLIVVAGQRCRDPWDRRTTTKFYTLQIVQIGSKEHIAYSIHYTFPSLEELGQATLDHFPQICDCFGKLPFF